MELELKFQNGDRCILQLINDYPEIPESAYFAVLEPLTMRQLGQFPADMIEPEAIGFDMVDFCAYLCKADRLKHGAWFEDGGGI